MSFSPDLPPPGATAFTASPPDVRRSLAPTAGGERLINIDFVRGVALLGILFVNVSVMFGPLAALMEASYVEQLSAGDRAAALLVRSFCQGKFISTFSLLFGYGLYNQMQKAAASGRSPAGFTFRRLGVLALFGFVHAVFLWFGDVLFMYAMIGAWLLLGRRAGARTLAIVGFSLLTFALFVLVVLIALGAMFDRPGSAEPQPVAADMRALLPDSVIGMMESGWNISSPIWIAAEKKAYSRGPWIDAQIFRLFGWLGFNLTASVFFIGWMSLGMFFLGAALWRARFFAPEQGALRRRVCMVCLPLGLAFEAGAAYFYWAYPTNHVGALMLGQLVHQVGLFFLPLGYLSGLALLADRLPDWFRGPIASAGRMSLTVYLLESVIATGLAYHWGFGLFGSVGELQQLGVAVVLWASLVAFSHVWLRRYAYGPMEWLWRRMEYGK